MSSPILLLGDNDLLKQADHSELSLMLSSSQAPERPPTPPPGRTEAGPSPTTGSGAEKARGLKAWQGPNRKPSAMRILCPVVGTGVSWAKLTGSVQKLGALGGPH